MAIVFYIDDIHESLRVFNTDDFVFVKQEELEREGAYELKFGTITKLGDSKKEDKHHTYISQLMPPIVRIK